MKKIITVFFFFIISFLGVGNTQLQDISIVKGKIDTVNHTKLKKIILRADIEYDIGKKWRPLTKKEYYLLRGSKFSLPLVYLDNKNRVRKFIYTKNYSDFGENIIEYFDEQGSLVAVIFNNGVAAEYDIWGSIYYLNGKIVKVSSLNDLIEAGKRTVNRIPSKHYLRYDFNIKSLFQRYNIQRNQLINARHSEYVVFKEPVPGNITIINTNDVRFRDKPTSGKVIAKLKAFNEVKVLNVGSKETIKPYGTYHWYNVLSSVHNQTGYVFGAFLEPVEFSAK